jgi:hypothetical protein
MSRDLEPLAYHAEPARRRQSTLGLILVFSVFAFVAAIVVAWVISFGNK